jgi:hypothetical protein
MCPETQQQQQQQQQQHFHNYEEFQKVLVTFSQQVVQPLRQAAEVAL